MIDNLADLTKFLVAKFEALQGDLGIVDVFYGDQERIPRTPAACFEAGEKTRQLNGAPRRVMTNLTIYCLIYHNPIKSMQAVREEDDQLAEAIEAKIHEDPTFEGQVIDSLVTSIESGYQVKANSMFRASRLTIEARVQVQLPSAF